MTDKSKWFIYKLEDGEAFGCFRIKPFDNSKLQTALMDINIKNSIFKMNHIELYEEYTKIIATHAIQDWENVALQQKGEEEPEHETRYTPQNAYDLLMNSAIGLQLFNWIVEKSKSIR
ncbi:hypothetical protein ACLBWM_05710 [Acinetobacter radioresistens]